jgi:hypothetical protein
VTRLQAARNRSTRRSRERLGGILFPEVRRGGTRTPEDLGQRLADEELRASGLTPAVLGIRTARRGRAR